MLSIWGSTFPKPTLDLNFIGASSLDSRVTFTRASTATYFDSAGTLQTAAINAPRFDYNPSTLAARGLLIEEQRTNSIRNNTMVGAVAGTPGTLPTNWAVTNTAGLTTNVIGTGTTNGITWIDVQITGTPTGTAYALSPEPNNQIAASNGQSWSVSSFFAISGGAITNISGIASRVRSFNSGGSGLQVSAATDIKASLTSSLQRFTESLALTDATTAFVNQQILLTLTVSSAINITLRIGLPQLELGTFPTSVIPTTTTALTRSADVASMTGTNFSSWYNQTQGSLYAEYNIPYDSSTSVFPIAAGVSDGTYNNCMVNDERTIDDTRRAVIRVSGVVQFETSNGVAYTYGTNTKQILAYATNDVALSVSGTAPATSASASIPTVNQMGLGSNSFTSGSLSPLNGWLRRVAYYPTRLPNATLQALTA